MVKSTNITLILIFLVLTHVFTLRPASGQDKIEKETFLFLSTRVMPTSGNYLVIKDANVRDRPTTRGRRVGRRARGERVIVVGRAKGPWLAIRNEDGEDIGFIYKKTLIPIINGALKNTLEGRLHIAGSKACQYLVKFEDKSSAEGQVFKFSDYSINWFCKIAGQSLKFNTPMFLTEGAYRETSQSIHQITIDTLGLSESMERVLSTHILWDRQKQNVKFDSITVKKFGQKPNLNNVRAETVSDALHAAVRIAASVWNNFFWAVIGKSQPRTED